MVYRGHVARTDHTWRTADRGEVRLDFETLVSDLSSRFINLSGDEVDGAVENALRRVCEFLELDYAVLWQWSASAPAVLLPTHAYPDQVGPKAPANLSVEQFPWFLQEMVAGRTVVFSSAEELPPEAAVDRESCRRLGVKSNLTIPLSAGAASRLGVLGFNAVRAKRDWPDGVVKRLQLVAQVFTNALARKRAEDALRESEERLALAADSAEAGLWTLDHSTGVFWATDRARALFGFSPDEVITMERFQASVHPDDWGLVRETMARSARTGEPIDVDYRIILPEGGGVGWVTSRGRPRHKPTGEQEGMTGVSIDITERKHTEEALRASEARLEAGVELAGLAFYEVDFDEAAVYIDDRFRDLCGIPPDRRQGLQALEFWIEHVHPDDRPRVMDQRRLLHDGRLEELFVEYRFLPPGQRQKWLQHIGRVAARDATGRAVKSYGVLRDVTERKRAEDELRDLSQRLIGAHEAERALLARELHDDVSQRLAVLAIDVGRAELAAPDTAQAAAMQAVRSGLVRLSEDIHSLAYQLHPSVLEELGLVEALRTECERRGRQGRLDLSLDLDSLPTTIGKDAALCLFRVAQEALNNVDRHAGVRAARVTLRPMDGGLALAVSDEGIGFDAEHPKAGMHLGLASMRERVRLVRGTLDIESAPDEGTTILAWVPAAEAS